MVPGRKRQEIGMKLKDIVNIRYVYYSTHDELRFWFEPLTPCPGFVSFTYVVHLDDFLQRATPQEILSTLLETDSSDGDLGDYEIDPVAYAVYDLCGAELVE